MLSVSDLSQWSGWFEEQQAAMLTELKNLVEQETPSGENEAIQRVQTQLGEKFARLGGQVDIIEGPKGNHLKVSWGEAGPDNPQILAVGHIDTVWPMGTLARKPFKVEDGLAFGPGVYDMKAGIVLLQFAMQALQQHNLKPARPFTILITADEEVGSRTSRSLIEAEAKKAACALVLEPPLENGAVKTARKGVGQFSLKIEGRAAHAGVEPEKGVNALIELAHQMLAINALNDYSRGTTLNVGVAQGGTRSNVVPAKASAEIDLRVSTLAEAQRIEAALKSLLPVLPEAALMLEGGLNRPPFERTAAVVELFNKAKALYRAVEPEVALEEGSTGGGSDGNFTAALGIPTLDGLGAVGKGAHAEHEQVLINSLPRRAHLLAAILTNF